MEARAQVTHVRMSPRKVKVVLDLIRNKPVEIATAIVKNTSKAACEPVGKLLALSLIHISFADFVRFHIFRKSETHPSPTCIQFRHAVTPRLYFSTFIY